MSVTGAVRGGGGGGRGMSGGGAAVVETRVSVREDLLSLLSGALAISSPVAVLVAVVTL